MLNDANGFKHIYLACGKTDLRKGLDNLVRLINNTFELNAFEEGSIFLFCGTRKDRLKAVCYEGDGFVLLSKKLLKGSFRWPQNSSDIKDITEEQYHRLMDGFEIEYRSSIQKFTPDFY